MSFSNPGFYPLADTRHIGRSPRLMASRPFGGYARNRRIAVVGTLALPYMTAVSLLAWRSTSRDNCTAASNHLRSTLYTLVSRFFPDPIAFLNILTPWGALVVGEAALSHLLQQPTLCDANFEVAVGNLYFESFLDNLSRLFPVGSTLISRLDRQAPHGFPFHRHITRISEFRLASGLFITVYESATPSACDVVAGYWSTALMNFATAYSMGSAYPRLTFDKYALICDTRTSTMEWADRNVQGRLTVYGFDYNHNPDGWPLATRDLETSGSLPSVRCGSWLYACPHQGRFFGDPGSLVLFYDGPAVDLEALRDLCIAPYGPMVAWRLPSSGTCEGNCLERDPVLPPFVVSILMHFMESYTKLGQPRDTPSGASLHEVEVTASSSPTYQLCRRYSV